MSFPGAAGSGTADAGAWSFNPPPGWPAPPPGWQPPPGWEPDPAWPPAPEGWTFWVPAPGFAAAPAPGAPAGPGPSAGAAPSAPAVTEVRLSLGGQTFVVRPGQEGKVGRAPDNDIVASDPTVSRQHAVIRSGVSGWEYVKSGSAPTFLGGEQVGEVAIDRPLDLALGSPDGPVLHLEPVTGTVRVPPPAPVDATSADYLSPGPAAAPQQAPPVTPYQPAAAGAAAPGWPGSPGPGTPSYQQPGWGAPPGAAYQQGGWAGGVPPHYHNVTSEELGQALRILFPVQSWLHNSGWRQGLRLGVIAYALLPLIFLTVLSSSSDLSTPGWAYSLYVAPLWLAGFWMLIRPPTLPGKQEYIVAAAIVVWTLIWINVVTININDALPTKNGIGIVSAIVIGINEETTKALPVLLAGLALLKFRKVKLDVRMWMILGTIAGLTFGIAEQAFYTSADIIFINMARSPSEAVTAILAFAERVFVDGFQHAVWAGISGFFMGLAVNYRRRRAQLIIIGIGTPAILHALNDWLAGSSPWFVIIIQAASLLLFLGYTMTAASIEESVRQSEVFRGQSMIMEAFRLPNQPPPR